MTRVAENAYFIQQRERDTVKEYSTNCQRNLRSNRWSDHEC